MIQTASLISGFLLSLLIGLLFIWQIRGYLKTRMKSYLYRGICFLVILGIFLGVTIGGMISESFERYFGQYTIILIGALFVTAYYFRISATSLLIYEERVAWEQLCEKTTSWQRLTGNVPTINHQQLRPLPIGKRSGLVVGSFLTILGVIVTMLFILFKVSIAFMNIFIAAFVALILGLLLIIFSITCLDIDKSG